VHAKAKDLTVYASGDTDAIKQLAPIVDGFARVCSAGYQARNRQPDRTHARASLSDRRSVSPTERNSSPKG
jgi:hypothetical protein